MNHEENIESNIKEIKNYLIKTLEIINKTTPEDIGKIKRKYNAEISSKLVRYGTISSIIAYQEIIISKSFEENKEIVLSNLMKQIDYFITNDLKTIKKQNLVEKVNEIFNHVLQNSNLQDVEIYSITLRAVKNFGFETISIIPTLEIFLLEIACNDRLKSTTIDIMDNLHAENRTTNRFVELIFSMLKDQENEGIYSKLMDKLTHHIIPKRWDENKEKVFENLKHSSSVVREISAKIIDDRGRTGEGVKEIIDALNEEKNKETKIKLMAALGRVASSNNKEAYKILIEMRQGDKQELGIADSMLNQIARKNPLCQSFKDWFILKKPTEISNREKINLTGLVFSLFFNCLSIGVIIYSFEKNTVVLWLILVGMIIIVVIIFVLIGGIYLKYWNEKRKFGGFL
jgi:hypothetical protein